MKRKTMTAIAILIALLFLVSTVVRGETLIRIFLDGTELDTDVTPVIVDGRTLVPLRVISENLGAAIQWNGETRTVDITSPSRQFMNGYREQQMYVKSAEEVKPLFESAEMNIL
ncbi:MAG: copper amine oxidase N-terminal domain-containing protein, partial [Bacillota bacterium]|nr:copper amine oxidase N-terminal domain-containing protein [Bacillota bacterium]